MCRINKFGLNTLPSKTVVIPYTCGLSQDIINEREFYAQRRAERDKRKAERAAYREDKRRRKADAQFNMRLGAASPWESDVDRYLHAYSQTSEEDITEEESDDEE